MGREERRIISIFLWNHHGEVVDSIINVAERWVSIFLWNHLPFYDKDAYRLAIALAFQYSSEIIRWFLLVSIIIMGIAYVSIFLWNHPPGWFLSVVLKFFLSVSWFSWGRVSAPSAYGSCLFPRFVLGIELLFPRNFNPHGNGSFPR